MLRVFLPILFLTCCLPAGSWAEIPVIYSTDLYHPHDDPDDHYDLATLFILPELDVRGILIDMVNIHQKRLGQGRKKEPGTVALQQIFHLTGKQAPHALGLSRPLQSDTDPGTDQPGSDQGGVQLILSVLRTSPEQVNIFTVGSLVDVAAAYNREPELLRRKVRMIYVNAGNGPDGEQTEWNVRLDPRAYRRILLSDLPIAWYPCFGRNNYVTYFKVDQAEILRLAPAPLCAFFCYALRHSEADPIPYLSGTYPMPEGPRNMWCTPSFLDLAGRKIYRTSSGYQALPEPPAPNVIPVHSHEMQSIALTATDDHTISFRADFNAPQGNVRVFRKQKSEYERVMASVLKHLLAGR
ncbi:MAG: nucleoside hydrolase [Pirellulales bacterium]|nr:nucleoside hydrolase [Pirellulales bacterium]